MCLLPLPHLIRQYQSASARHSVRCFVSSLFLSTKINFFFWSRFELFTQKDYAITKYKTWAPTQPLATAPMDHPGHGEGPFRHRARSKKLWYPLTRQQEKGLLTGVARRLRLPMQAIVFRASPRERRCPPRTSISMEGSARHSRCPKMLDNSAICPSAFLSGRIFFLLCPVGQHSQVASFGGRLETERWKFRRFCGAVHAFDPREAQRKFGSAGSFAEPRLVFVFVFELGCPSHSSVVLEFRERPPGGLESANLHSVIVFFWLEPRVVQRMSSGRSRACALLSLTDRAWALNLELEILTQREAWIYLLLRKTFGCAYGSP